MREVGGRQFRHNGSLFAWGREYCCGVVGDTQERTKEVGKPQAGLRHAEEWHSTPVGEKIELHNVGEMRKMGMNHNFQPHRKNGVVWPNYTPCQKFERPPPPDQDMCS